MSKILLFVFLIIGLAARAALLTGCYPKRVSMHQHVLFPSSKKGPNPSKHNIADHLKGQGNATACFVHGAVEFMKSLDSPSAKKAYPDFRNALGTQYVCDAVLESAKSGQWVDVKKA